MNKYKNYRIEEFVWDTSFRRWVLSPTRENNLVWEQWIAENPAMSETLHAAKDIILSLNVSEPEISDEAIRQSVQAVVGKVNSETREIALEPRFSQLNFWLRVAASVTLICSLVWFGNHFYGTRQKKEVAIVVKRDTIPDPAFVEKVNNGKSAIRVNLEDGSTVTLKKGGKLRYDKHFAKDRREIYLTGGAFFEVAKDPDRPFLVYAKELVTKVLGTSFSIEAYEGSDNITVEVKTGRVSVFAKSDPEVKQKATNRELNGVVLTPNQKITYNRGGVRLVKSLVENPEVILPKSKSTQFEFEETPASEVFATIAKAYGIDILYDEDLLKDCPLNASLDTQTLHEKLTIICKAVEAQYEILDGQIVIHSKGCRN